MATWELRARADMLHELFSYRIHEYFPGRDKWDWFRACAAINGQNTRRNDDTADDSALAACAPIREAYDGYIKALHAFYCARDGERGVLGAIGHA